MRGLGGGGVMIVGIFSDFVRVKGRDGTKPPGANLVFWESQNLPRMVALDLAGSSGANPGSADLISRATTQYRQPRRIAAPAPNQAGLCGRLHGAASRKE